jgi:hypothetical protein
LSILDKKNKLILQLNLNLIGLIIGLMPFLFLFGWYNFQTTGSGLKIAQMIGRSDYFEQNNQNIASEEVNSPAAYQIKLPFDTRKQLHGLYILLLSNQRGWLFYSPVVLIGLFGLILLFRNKPLWGYLIANMLLINLVIYSLFPDPWGGWAFGPRYLIPAAALLCTCLGCALQRYEQNLLFNFIFFPTFQIYIL